MRSRFHEVHTGCGQGRVTGYGRHATLETWNFGHLYVDESVGTDARGLNYEGTVV